MSVLVGAYCRLVPAIDVAEPESLVALEDERRIDHARIDRDGDSVPDEKP